MKKTNQFLVMAFCMMFTYTLKAQMTASDPVYIETISNTSKTTNFIVGIYPKTFVYSAASENSKLTMRILNKADGEYKWKDYKVYLLLKDNSLFYNYTTKAESGDFLVNYSIEGGGKGFHEQVLCFSKKFDVDDIKLMWISFADDTFIQLTYSKGND
ncbi:MAG: hypothetical protein WCP69_08060 [Bacteroidota bacterium]|jgi:hypothetical protein